MCKYISLFKKQLRSINQLLKIKHIIIGIYNYIFNHNTLLSYKRKRICNKCRSKIVIEQINFCNICGCSIALKTRVIDEKCPIDKW